VPDASMIKWHGQELGGRDFSPDGGSLRQIAISRL